MEGRLHPSPHTFASTPHPPQRSPYPTPSPTSATPSPTPHHPLTLHLHIHIHSVKCFPLHLLVFPLCCCWLPVENFMFMSSLGSGVLVYVCVIFLQLTGTLLQLSTTMSASVTAASKISGKLPMLMERLKGLTTTRGILSRYSAGVY